MQDFRYWSPTEVIFGRNAEDKIHNDLPLKPFFKVYHICRLLPMRRRKVFARFFAPLPHILTASTERRRFVKN